MNVAMYVACMRIRLDGEAIRSDGRHHIADVFCVPIGNDIAIDDYLRVSIEAEGRSLGSRR